MSHTRFLYHIVFRTKDGFPFITESWEGELFKYLVGIIKNQKGFVIEINGMPDHIHILVCLGPCDFSAFMREVKSGSSKWAKQYSPKFSWQRRYGAFTVSESAVEAVRKYIRNQKEHHKQQTFESEYVALLQKHNVEFNGEHLWD